MIALPILLLFLIGVGLLITGVRGRLIDPERLSCGGCGFDLTGVFPAIGTCPECGSGLSDEAGIRRGIWVRQPWRVWAGGGLMGLMLASGVFWIATASGGTAITYAPVWWLRMQGRYAGLEAGRAALDEIADRISDGRLTTPGPLIQETLQRQADLSTSWNPGWGNIFTAAESKGLVTPAQSIQFRRGAVKPVLTALPRVRAGEPVSMEIGFENPGREFVMARAGTREDVCLVSSLVGAALDGRKLKSAAAASPKGGRWSAARDVQTVRADSRGVASGPAYFASPMPDLQMQADGPPGHRTLTAYWNVYLLKRPGDTTPLDVWPVEVSAPVEVRGPGEPLVDLRTGSAIRDSMQKALRVSIGRPGIIKDPSVPNDPELRLPEVKLAWDRLPGPTCWKMSIRCAGREWPMWYHGGTVNWEAGTADYSVDGWYDLSPQDVDLISSQKTFDVILRPDIEQAHRRGFLEICGDEIEFKNVPFVRSGR
ncbi:MAG: hypothetical protein IT436_18095 [Phycisphaerales bacterium]|nr:hypothetical protein [Phycisphaerales bacterium]